MPPYPPAPRTTDKLAVGAFVVSLVSLLFALSEGTRNADYRGNVAEGVGANIPAILAAIVAAALAIGALRRIPKRGQKGKGLAIAAIVLAGLTGVSCILHIVVLIGT